MMWPIRRGRGQDVLAGGAQVVGGAGFDGGDPDRVPGRIGQDLDVAAVVFVFAGVPQVGAGFAGGAVGGGDPDPRVAGKVAR